MVHALLNGVRLLKELFISVGCLLYLKDLGDWNPLPVIPGLGLNFCGGVMWEAEVCNLLMGKQKLTWGMSGVCASRGTPTPWL